MRNNSPVSVPVLVVVVLGLSWILGCASSQRSAFDPVEYSEKYSNKGKTDTHSSDRPGSGTVYSPKYYVYRDENGVLNAVPLRHRTPRDMERIQRRLIRPTRRPANQR